MNIELNNLIIKNDKCATEQALKFLCGKWNAYIIHTCILRPASIIELKNIFSIIPPTSLQKKLSYLCENNLLYLDDKKYFATNQATELLEIAKEIEDYLSRYVPELLDMDAKYNYVNKMIGQKWKARILWVLFNYKVVRFNELCHCLEGISHKVLKEVLDDLISTDMIIRKDYHEKTPKVEYLLTEQGHEMARFVDKLRLWSEKYGLLTQKVTAYIS